jgi:predicted HicB family RNase H-like nuclease
MTYKGHTAQIQFSAEDQCFVGHIAAIKDVVGFHAESISEMKAAFEEVVDDYLETREALRKKRALTSNPNAF